MPVTPLPDVVAHADWSVSAAKRWVAWASRRQTGGTSSRASAPFGDTAARLARLTARPARWRRAEGSVLLGLDLPLGLPEAYCRLAGITDVARWLRVDADLVTFARPAATPSEITPTRPLYPARPGGARRDHLVSALGVESFDDLRRACERQPPLTRAACPVFWTLGANQVGRGAVLAWREIVREGGCRVWPFDGDLAVLVRGGGVVAAEVYPTACAEWLGVGFGRRESKRRQSDRVARAQALLDAAASPWTSLVTGDIRVRVEDGFGSGAMGEDAFDAFVGMTGMVHVLRGRRAAGPPPELADTAALEGWVLGVG